MLSCLDLFSRASGQRVNMSKSCLFVSPNVDPSLVVVFSSQSGIPLTMDLGRYLGVSSIHGRVTASTYNNILVKMRDCLKGWKANALSKAGRITPVQYVLNAILVFIMQSALLPILLCNEMEKLCRNFIRHGKSIEHATHLVNWDTV